MRVRVPKNPEEMAKVAVQIGEKDNQNNKNENRKDRRKKSSDEKRVETEITKKINQVYKKAFTKSVTSDKERYKDIVENYINQIKTGKSKRELINSLATEYQKHYDKDGVADLLRYYLNPEINLAYREWLNEAFISQFAKAESYMDIRSLATQIKQKAKSPESIKSECKALITTGDRNVAKRLKEVITESLSKYEPPIDNCLIADVTGYTGKYCDFWRDNLVTDQRDYTSSKFTNVQNYMNFETLRQEIKSTRRYEKSEQDAISKLIKEEITSIQNGSYKNNNQQRELTDEEKLKLECTKVAILLRRKSVIMEMQNQSIKENKKPRYSQMSIIDD